MNKLTDILIVALYRQWGRHFYSRAFVIPNPERLRMFRQWLSNGLEREAKPPEDCDRAMLVEYHLHKAEESPTLEELAEQQGVKPMTKEALGEMVGSIPELPDPIGEKQKDKLALAIAMLESIEDLHPAWLTSTDKESVKAANTWLSSLTTLWRERQ